MLSVLKGCESDFCGAAQVPLLRQTRPGEISRAVRREEHEIALAAGRVLVRVSVRSTSDYFKSPFIQRNIVGGFFTSA